MMTTVLAPWDDDSSKRSRSANYFVDMKKIANTENILVFLRDTDGNECENGHLFVIKPPKCHVSLLSGVSPEFGIKLDDRGCIFVRN